jgi:hypothetical protein
MHATEHTYRVVRPESFRHLSRDFYDSMQQRLQALGFRHVADVEDETVKRQKPDPRTFLRIMTTPDGVVNATIYQVRPTLLWRLLMFLSGMRATRNVEFQTELENGYQVVTTTLRSQDLFPTSPRLYRNFQPREMPVDNLYQSHLDIVERVAREARVKPMPNVTLDDILGFENRQIALQHEHLASIGWVTKDYLLKQSGGNQKVAEALYEEIQNILREEQQSEG